MLQFYYYLNVLRALGIVMSLKFVQGIYYKHLGTVLAYLFKGKGRKDIQQQKDYCMSI